MKDRCSLVISTYNWPSALNLCLQSVLQQSILPNEIIIADDGSTEDTKRLIDSFNKKTSVPIIHVWHEDNGFRLAQIRNRAIAKAACPYIIQIDGDLILHRHFIKDHLQIRQHGYFVTGSRVLLCQDTSNILLQNGTIDRKLFNNNSKNLFNKFRNRFLRGALSRYYKTRGKHKFYVKGCNMAFWKSDLVKVNGYNEKLTGWGREDSELAVRLINLGVKKKFLKLGGVTYHIFHKEASRDSESANIAAMNEAIRLKIVWADKGINQYTQA